MENFAFSTYSVYSIVFCCHCLCFLLLHGIACSVDILFLFTNGKFLRNFVNIFKIVMYSLYDVYLKNNFLNFLKLEWFVSLVVTLPHWGFLGYQFSLLGWTIVFLAGLLLYKWNVFDQIVFTWQPGIVAFRQVCLTHLK